MGVKFVCTVYSASGEVLINLNILLLRVTEGISYLRTKVRRYLFYL